MLGFFVALVGDYAFGGRLASYFPGAAAGFSAGGEIRFRASDFARAGFSSRHDWIDFRSTRRAKLPRGAPRD
jgi:hypothetical protein